MESLSTASTSLDYTRQFGLPGNLEAKSTNIGKICRNLLDRSDKTGYTEDY